MKKDKVYFINLGCFRNLYDSTVISKIYLSQGYTLAYDLKEAEIVVVNTCGFIDQAKKENLQVIEELCDLKRKGKIKKLVVRGCLVQRYIKQLRRYFPEIDEFVGVLPLKKAFLVSAPLNYFYPPGVGFLKIAEGCSYHCSYCTIPAIKGTFTSKRWETIIEEAQYLEKKGIKELNLIAQNTTGWGKDRYQDKDIVFLLKKLIKKTNIPWIRLLYLHPHEVSQDLLELISREERICRYLDLPLQHVNDKILQLMRRRTTKEMIYSLIKKIRSIIPEAALRTSLIVGFPGETEKDFEELLNFVKEVRFDRLGVFIYSREEGTPAFDFPSQIHHATKRKRYRKIMSLQQQISWERNQRFIGRRLPVLIEEQVDKATYLGRTEFDAYEVDGYVFVKGERLKVGDFSYVEIEEGYEYDLIGRAVKN